MITKNNSLREYPYLKFLTNLDNLQMLCYLGDLFNVHTRFQKQLQANDLNIVKLDAVVAGFKHNISDLKCNVLLGGWEETLKGILRQDNGGDYSVHEIQLQNTFKRVPNTRNFQICE